MRATDMKVDNNFNAKMQKKEKQMKSLVVFLSIAHMFNANLAYAQCTKDTDCKGTRICENSKCVNVNTGNSNRIEKPRSRQRDPRDKILVTTDANFSKGIEWIGGKFILTGRKIIFISHKLNVQSAKKKINLKSIKKLEKFGLIPNGLRIYTKNGDKYEFRVDKREKIIRLINKNR